MELALTAQQIWRKAATGLVAVVIGAGLLAGCDNGPKQAGKKAPPPPGVIVSTVKQQDLQTADSYTGRIEAIDTVDIRARVQGFLQKRLFKEGDNVKKGDLLYEIEPDVYENAVKQAEANLASSKASVALAQVTFNRYSKLQANNVASKAKLDEARAQLAQGKANVQSSEAALASANLDLSYTKIFAPIAGRIGRSAYSEGNLVGSSSDPLVKIVSQDPVFATFPVPQKVILRVRKQLKSGEIKRGSVFVELVMADDSIYQHKGTINFAAVQALSSTDSVMVRANVANPDGFLVDQQLITVRVVRNKPELKLTVSQAALVIDQEGSYVLLVDKDKKVEQRRIEVGEQRGPDIVVTAGLQKGDTVIVSGHQKVRPGMTVSVNQVTTGNDKKSPEQAKE